ncbi:MAG: hypothetical protein WDN31_04650 [Hyphomicrobium sp.]
MDLRDVTDDAFTIKFGGPHSEIDVYTLSEALTGIADALWAINAVVNPDVELEVIFESSAEGSFLAKIRLSKRAKTVFSRVGETVVLGLLINYVSGQLMYEKPTYTVEGDNSSWSLLRRSLSFRSLSLIIRTKLPPILKLPKA